MSFSITDLEYYVSPDQFDLDGFLSEYGICFAEIEQLLKGQVFTHKNASKGFQVDLAKQLEDLLRHFFRTKGERQVHLGSFRYSARLGEKPDVAIEHAESGRVIFVEVEFRPNEFKDIVKFQIGHRKGNLGLGILVVAKHKRKINANYHTMPEYSKCRRIIEELQPDCPILLIGIDGMWS